MGEASVLIRLYSAELYKAPHHDNYYHSPHLDLMWPISMVKTETHTLLEGNNEKDLR